MIGVYTPDQGKWCIYSRSRKRKLHEF